MIYLTRHYDNVILPQGRTVSWFIDPVSGLRVFPDSKTDAHEETYVFSPSLIFGKHSSLAVEWALKALKYHDAYHVS